MYNKFSEFLKDKNRICIIQAENPDGDSLGSALALDYIIGRQTNERSEKIEVSLYCPVDLPKYLHYFTDWSRVSIDFDFKADGYIIVDTAAKVLLTKLVEDSAIFNHLEEKPVLVLDHHESADDLDFSHEAIIEILPACCSLIYHICKEQNIGVEKPEAEYLVQGIMSDTLGLTSANVASNDFRDVAELIDAGANIAELEENRKEFMKKSQRILDYKADLIKRIDYHLDGALATIHIPWEDIQEYSDEYNPNVLILEEMRMVEGVEVAVAIKTYPDGRLTGKIRSSLPCAGQVAGFFGGGGHPYAAGFRTYDLSYEDCVRELVSSVSKILEENKPEESETNFIGSF